MTIKYDNLIGKKFNRLTILNIIPGVTINKKRISRRSAECLCDCGSKKTTYLRHLIDGRCKSCGCYAKDLFKEMSKKRNYKHGMATRADRKSEYRTWCHIKERCTNPNNKNYAIYGGRGIKICPGWEHNFQEFFNYVKEKPGIKYSLDRINNDGNYEPGNVRWATQKEQVNNSSLFTSKIELTCKVCNIKFTGLKARALNTKYCSKYCSMQGNKIASLICRMCGIPFNVIPFYADKRKYCSHVCRIKGLKD